MSPRIFVLKGTELIEMVDSPYGSEDQLQELLEEYPAVISGDQDPTSRPRRYVLVKREEGIPATQEGTDRWSLDHLFLDQEGIPTFVEVKRSSDTRIRREVVGQMLDYAANGPRYWSVDRLRLDFESTCALRGFDPDAEIERLVDEGDVESFWEQVTTNLEARRLRLLFVADSIPRELQSIIEFLNEGMPSVEVLGLEVRQFAAEGEGVRTLVATVIGQTAAAQAAKSQRGPSEVTTEEKLTAQVAHVNPRGAPVVSRLLRWAEGRGLNTLWGTAAVGSCYLGAASDERMIRPVYLHGSGYAYVYLSELAAFPPFDSDEMRRELLRRLNEIPEVSLDPNAISKGVKVPFAALSQEGSFGQFIQVLDWILEEVGVK